MERQVAKSRHSLRFASRQLSAVECERAGQHSKDGNAVELDIERAGPRQYADPFEPIVLRGQKPSDVLDRQAGVLLKIMGAAAAAYWAPDAASTGDCPVQQRLGGTLMRRALAPRSADRPVGAFTGCPVDGATGAKITLAFQRKAAWSIGNFARVADNLNFSHAVYNTFKTVLIVVPCNLLSPWACNDARDITVQRPIIL